MESKYGQKQFAMYCRLRCERVVGCLALSSGSSAALCLSWPGDPAWRLARDDLPVHRSDGKAG